MSEFVRAATLAQVPPGTLFAVQLGEERICIVNVDGDVYALQDNCSHKDFPLSASELDDGKLVCGWHGSRFDPATGRALSLPAIKPVKTYDVKVEGDDIYVAIE